MYAFENIFMKENKLLLAMVMNAEQIMSPFQRFRWELKNKGIEVNYMSAEEKKAAFEAFENRHLWTDEHEKRWCEIWGEK